MTNENIACKIIRSTGGVARTADFVKAGLSNYDVMELCNKGIIERIRHGFYCLPDEHYNISDAFLLGKLIPDGIVCVESALFHYGYSDFCPREWTIAVPRTISRQKLVSDAIAVKAYYVSEPYFDIGITSEDFDGTMLKIYDRERTICDCFKYRNKLDSELFGKAVRNYAADSKKNITMLSEYAQKMRVHKKVTDIMEVLLND